MIVDPISDMFTRIRNANLKLHDKVDIPFSKFKFSILKVLKTEGYISNYEIITINKNKFIRTYLKYTLVNKIKKSVITNLIVGSKSSLRVYKNVKNIPKTFGGLGVTIISTSKGILTDEQAKYTKVGGEVVGYIW
ncbi:MAG: 30S ribosomal protein S8 [Endomicrobium sp.]|jgi:small subunit ribosomal protein S8|nr:30S ribosomal protein S8 [Endomicrobium sp.]